MQTVQFFSRKDAATIVGGLTQTSKMPGPSYSLPTAACHTGWRMAQIPGSICSKCYANKGFYSMYHATIEPAQHARLASLEDPDWIPAMVALIVREAYFRWHDSGDLQGLEHLEQIAEVCRLTPNTRHWLPTREYGVVKEFIAKHGSLPPNLMVRLSAMYPDKPVQVPASLRGIPNVTVSNVHSKGTAPMGQRCAAPDNGGKCGDCRACWHADDAVSYEAH